MEVRVIKGTNQIGGCITEIKTKEARIIIDFGDDLVDEDEGVKIPVVEGLTCGESCYDAVFITHGHGDHIGLINEINKDIPVYVEEKSKRMFNVTNDFISHDSFDVVTKAFEFGKTIYIKDIKITPFRTDHSWFNSAMFLIEADGKKILHTGDFRLHGRKGEEEKNNLEKIGKVDLLITEGTCLSRDDSRCESEFSLEISATEMFRKYNQVFLLQSSINIDRIVSFYKASIRSKKKYFIEDLFTAVITNKLLHNVVPNPKHFDNVSVWVPGVYRNKPVDFKEKYMEPMEQYKNSQAVHNDFTMMVKASMLDDIKMLKSKGLLTNACLVYSMWDGYKKQEGMKEFLDEIEKLGIEIKTLHTSGHADLEAMKWLNEKTNPNNTIVIHTENGQKGKEIFNNVVELGDGEYFEVK